MDVAAQSIQLCNDDRGLVLFGCLQRRRQLRSTIERIGALPCFDLLERLKEIIALSFGETGQCCLLCLQAKA